MDFSGLSTFEKVVYPHMTNFWLFGFFSGNFYVVSSWSNEKQPTLLSNFILNFISRLNADLSIKELWPHLSADLNTTHSISCAAGQNTEEINNCEKGSMSLLSEKRDLFKM